MKAFFKDVFRRMAVLFSICISFCNTFAGYLSFFADSLISPKEERIEDDSFWFWILLNLTDRPAGVSFEDLTRQALTDEKMIPEYHLKELIDGLSPLRRKKKSWGIFITVVPSGYGCRCRDHIRIG